MASRMKNFMNTSIDWSNFNSTLLIEVTRPEGVFTSSGVAINSQTVLTAAHCLEGEVLKVRVSRDMTYSQEGNFFEVASFEIHPDYDNSQSNFKFDLAKIKLKNHLPADTNFFPILKKEKDLIGKIMRLGFGARSDKNTRTLITPVFKEVHSLEKVLELNDTYSFAGDSGGPVFIQNNGQMYLVAIHSTLSHGPEGKFSFNPLVSPHRDWILTN